MLASVIALRPVSGIGNGRVCRYGIVARGQRPLAVTRRIREIIVERDIGIAAILQHISHVIYGGGLCGGINIILPENDIPNIVIVINVKNRVRKSRIKDSVLRYRCAPVCRVEGYSIAGRGGDVKVDRLPHAGRIGAIIADSIN